MISNFLPVGEAQNQSIRYELNQDRNTKASLKANDSEVKLQGEYVGDRQSDGIVTEDGKVTGPHLEAECSDWTLEKALHSIEEKAKTHNHQDWYYD